MNDWLHQTVAVDESVKAINRGVRRFCITSPTGGGKSRIVHRLVERGYRTVILTNRTMLMEQWCRGLDAAGHPFDMQASGYAPTAFNNVTIGMVQTISRRWLANRADLPPADIVFLDEAHNETGPRICEILDEFNRRGAVTIPVTATPIGIGHMAEELIVAGVTSDLRRCGALVAAQTYAPDEPSMDSFRSTAKGILQIHEELREVWFKAVHGRVIDHYHKLNPDQRPSILFAPGVEESRWFAEQFNAEGIPWSHIDSREIILNGEVLPATRANRERLRLASQSGETRGISNRFVLREGIDFPWLAHGIFACTFGSLCSYLQAGGRLLRAHPSLSGVVVQDHGGNFWRHDSLNADRQWRLDDTDKSLRDQHDERYRSKAEPEPIVCPKCSKVRHQGAVCPACGFAYTGRRRMVIQTDGTLSEVHGDIYKPRKVNTAPDAHKRWVACYFRSLKSGRTFKQARATYQHENYGTVPGDDFPLVPKMAADWALPVRDVPRERLTPYTKPEAVTA